MGVFLDMNLLVLAVTLALSSGEHVRTYQMRFAFEEVANAMCTDGSHVLITALRYKITWLASNASILDEKTFKHYKATCENGTYCGWPRQYPRWISPEKCTNNTCSFDMTYKCIKYGVRYTIDMNHANYWEEPLCPGDSIVRIDDVESSRQLSCDDTVPSTTNSNDSYSLMMRLKCDGRQKCEKLEPADLAMWRCYFIGNNDPPLSGVTYRCLEANTEVILCGDETFESVSCDANRVIDIQNVLHGATCTDNRNKTCIGHEPTERSLYLLNADSRTLGEVKQQCHGKSECAINLGAKKFLKCSAEWNQSEIKDVRIYFKCQNYSFQNRIAEIGPFKFAITCTLISILMLVIVVLWIKYRHRCPNVTCIAGGSLVVELGNASSSGSTLIGSYAERNPIRNHYVPESINLNETQSDKSDFNTMYGVYEPENDRSKSMPRNKPTYAGQKIRSSKSAVIVGSIKNGCNIGMHKVGSMKVNEPNVPDDDEEHLYNECAFEDAVHIYSSEMTKKRNSEDQSSTTYDEGVLKSRSNCSETSSKKKKVPTATLR